MTISPLNIGYQPQAVSLMSVSELMELFDNGKLLDGTTRRSFTKMPANGKVLMDILMNQYRHNLPLLTLNHNQILEPSANNQNATGFILFIAALSAELATLKEQHADNPFLDVLKRYASLALCKAYQCADDDTRYYFEERLYRFQIPVVIC